MSFPTSFSSSAPDYNPDEFNLSDNYNILHVSEIHAFEPEHRKDQYKQHVGEQLDKYAEKYNIDTISVLGDTGTIEDVEDIFSHVDDNIELWIVAGDEDKVNPRDKEAGEKEWYGWFEAASSPKPFDLENEYRIFDEGYQTDIEGRTVQAAHHPCNSKRDDRISSPDPRYNERSNEEPETPEELFELQNQKDFIDQLFSVKRDTNENTLRKNDLSRNSGDILVYDHVHMPYPRKVYEKAVIGLGGRSHNYQIEADSIPIRSLHINSHGKDLVHTMHFDADRDQIFEHEIFDFSEDELDFYFTQLDDNTGTPHNAGYIPLQARFLGGQYREKAEETPENYPELWVKKD